MSLVSKMVYFNEEEWKIVKEWCDKAIANNQNKRIPYAKMFRSIILGWMKNNEPSKADK